MGALAGTVPRAADKTTVTLIPGDGIGPEITDAVEAIFEAAGAPVAWDKHVVSAETCVVNERGIMESGTVLESLNANKIGLKGPLGTPIGMGHVSLNITLRKTFGLYANVRPCLSVPGVNTPYANVNIVTIRENTEGEYSGIEHEITPGVCAAVKLITKQASQNVADYAFGYAKANGRKCVTAVHKANVLKKADGLFLQCTRAAAAANPDIDYKEETIDSVAYGLARDPSNYDMMVMPNLYGDIISDLGAGLIGGLGLTASGNIGREGMAIFESVHGTAPDIAGQGKANPTALLFSGVMMLRHMGATDVANNIEQAALHVLHEGKDVTGDLGGSGTTSGYANAIIAQLNKM